MLSFQLFDTDLYNIIHWFFLYSFIGWVIECAVISHENGHFTNRGFLHGPFCILYGFGALCFYFILKPFSNNIVLLFVGGLLIATLLELITAKLMLRLFGAFWWDYSQKRCNYKGILCLESSIAWGLLTICLFSFIHRVVTGAVSAYPPLFGKTAAVFLLGYVIIDFIVSLYQVIRYGESVLPENAAVAKRDDDSAKSCDPR